MELSSLTRLLPASLLWLGRDTIKSLPLYSDVALSIFLSFEEKNLLDIIIIIAIVNSLTFPSIYAISLSL